jgi:hypothetical protein
MRFEMGGTDKEVRMRGKRLLLAVLLIGSLFFSLVAWATPENLVLILDASNSMNKPFDGESRLDVAKGALSELLEILPEGVNVGLLIYGHRIAKSDREASCQDIESLFPLLPFSASVGDEMTAAFLRVKAQGLTPLADALIEASDEISAFSGESAIVLISDGEETCGGDPLVVAQMIATMTPPTLLHVIGLDVEEQVRATMIAMAEATGGEYRDVSKAKDLFAALLAVISPPEELPTLQIPPEYACMGITNVIYGTEGDDILYGTPGNDLIYGLGGNDLLIGLAGNDILLGGDGNDILEGGDGSDALLGGAGNDVLLGGAGDDILCGGPGNDSLEGEEGNDCLDGGTGNDQLLGGPGCNRLYGGGGCDVLLEGKVVNTPCVVCPPLPVCLPVPVCPPVPVCVPVPVCPPPPVAPPCVTPSDRKSVDEGASIQLHGTIVDHDCNVVQTFWRAEAGRFDDSQALHPIYYAPMTDRCEGEDVLVTLTAVDSCGATGSDSFILHINNVNHPPVAEVGENLVIDECTSIQLTCSASDIDGDALTYHWTAECGRGSFNDPSLLHPVYTAPATTHCEGENIVLTLTVTDKCGATASDSLIVHVRNVNHAPSANAGEDLVIDECASVELTCSASDPDGDMLTYRWTAECGRGTFDDPTRLHPCYIAPATDRCEGEDILLTFTVRDACGLSSSDSLRVHVNNLNLPPIVKADP